MDFAKTEDQQQIFKLIFARQVMGRPFLAPPGVPKDRAEALRKAFMDTMKDPEFLADAEKSQLEITPVAGADVETLVKEIQQTPKALADKAARIHPALNFIAVVPAQAGTQYSRGRRMWHDGSRFRGDDSSQYD